jgi:hypothetical protein
MANELNNFPGSTTLDLSGLPEPVVESIKQLVDSLRQGKPREVQVQRPPLRGRFAELKLSIPKEDIDEAQREAWAAFPRDFPEPGKS